MEVWWRRGMPAHVMAAPRRPCPNPSSSCAAPHVVRNGSIKGCRWYLLLRTPCATATQPTPRVKPKDEVSTQRCRSVAGSGRLME
jgi:hypothetical protein